MYTQSLISIQITIIELRPLVFLLHTFQDVLEHLICRCLRQNCRLRRSQNKTSQTRRAVVKVENNKKHVSLEPTVEMRHRNTVLWVSGVALRFPSGDSMEQIVPGLQL